jgi:hypothetical protein
LGGHLQRHVLQLHLGPALSGKIVTDFLKSNTAPPSLACAASPFPSTFPCWRQLSRGNCTYCSTAICSSSHSAGKSSAASEAAALQPSLLSSSRTREREKREEGGGGRRTDLPRGLG